MVRRAFGAATGWRLGTQAKALRKKDTTSEKKTQLKSKKTLPQIEVASFLKKRHYLERPKPKKDTTSN